MLRIVGGLRRQNQPDLALVGELDGIAQQVGDNLLEAYRVNQHVHIRRRARLTHQSQLFLPRQAIKHACHGFNQ